MFITKLETNPDIYNIKILLPKNPLRDLNVYVIADHGEGLVIDTGFRMEVCRRGLTEGLRELGIPMERLQLFITHLHSDHAGQIDLFSKAGCPVYMNEKEIPLLEAIISGQARAYSNTRFLKNGYPKDVLARADSSNPMYAYAPREMMPLIPVRDGSILTVGNRRLRCIETGGHTPGHTCLYMDKEGILFSGDHVLYDITPNISIWEGVGDSLGMYMENLKKVKGLSFQAAYPAHRELHERPYDRIQELLEHHEIRLREVMRILREYPESSAYEVTSRMKWSICSKGWEDFPDTQKWFAMSEAMAHLDWLEKRGYIGYQEMDDGQIVVEARG